MGGRNAHVGQPDCAKAFLELTQRQRARDAADVAASLRSLLRAQTVLGDYVGNAHAPAGPQDASDLGEYRALVRREVDDAIADYDVDRVVWQRDVLDVPAQELDVGCAGLGDVLLGQAQHLVGHVEAEDSAGWPDAFAREQNVDSAAGAQVQHPFALAHLGDGDWVPAAE